MWTGAGAAGCLLIREIGLVEVRHRTGACCTAFRVHVGVQTYNGAVDRTPPPCIVPILWPVFADGSSRLADVLKIRAAEVLVLLHVKPEV